MTLGSGQVPQILELAPYEFKHNVIQNYERQYQHVRQVTYSWSKSERETVELLQGSMLSTEDYSGVHIGLYYTLLVTRDKDLLKKVFLTMLATSRDNLGTVITEMNRTIGEFWTKLLIDCKKQLLWLFGELVSHNQHADAVVSHLCKRMSNGDLSSVNIWLIEYMINFFSNPVNYRWLDSRGANNPIPIALLTFTFLRLIPDHCPTRAGGVNEMSAADQQRLSDLRAKEIKFTVNALRSCWRQCSVIGRELVRVLMDVARIPEFHALWIDLIHRPRVIPGCKGLKALMKMHSNTSIIAHSVPHDAEQWLKFLIRYVKLNTCHYYLEWFQRRFLSTPESQSLRPLLIRFVVVNVHSRASDQVQAELVGRHQVALWLVANCTPVTLVASCRLAIFFDWLLGDGNRYEEVVRLFEPGLFILVRCPPVNTSPLITFLLDLIHEFHPALTNEIRLSVVRVIQMVRAKHNEDLSPIFKNPDLDPAERQRLEHDLGDLLALQANPRLPAVGPPVSSAALAGPPLLSPASQQPSQAQQQPSAQQPGSTAAGPPQPLMGPSDAPGFRFPRPGPSQAAGGSSVAAVVGVQGASGGGRGRSQPMDGHGQTPLAPLTPPVEYPESVGDAADAQGGASTAVVHRRGERNDSVCSARFSDDGDLTNVTSNLDDLRRAFTNYKIRFVYRYRDIDVDSALQTLEEPHREHLRQIQRALNDTNNPDEATEIQNSAIDALVNASTQMGLDESTLHTVAAVLCQLYLPVFESKLLPHDVDEESLMNSYSSPLLQLFRYMIPSADLPDLDPRLCSLLAHMHACQPRVGYYLLYCLKLSSLHAPISDWNAIYCQFVTSLNCLPSEHQLAWTERGGVGEVLLKHMEIVASDDPDLLVFLLPDIVEQFPRHTRNSAAFIRLIVSTVDCKQVRDLVCQVLQGHLQLLEGADFQACLEDSLSWESIEQIFLWQLLNAHEIPTECFLPFLAKLRHGEHAEALFNLLLMFKLEKPNDELLKAVLDRDIIEKDHFSVSILHFWADRDQERLASLLDRFIADKFRDRKRSKPGKAKEFPPLERILGHLDHMRVVCKKNDILQSGTLQGALQHVHSNGGVTDELRSRFMDLFALALEPDLPQGAGNSAHGVPGTGLGHSASSTGIPTAGAAGEGGDRPRSLRNVAARKAAEAQRRQEVGGSHAKERRKGSSSGAGHLEKGGGHAAAAAPGDSSDSGSEEEAQPPRSKKRRAGAGGLLSQLNSDIFDDEA